MEIITAPGYRLRMSSHRRIGALVVVALAAGPAPPARAGGRDAAEPLLWATVNVCDTDAAPNTIGIRASMPGSPDGRGTMWMRFRVRYLSDADGRWRDVVEGGDSGFVAAGSASHRSRQRGRSFRIDSGGGEPVVLRGSVTFEWRVRGDVVRRASLRTRRGFHSSAGADPPGYSAATCTIIP